MTCLMRATDQLRPPSQRILDDPYAELFIGPAFRSSLQAARAARPPQVRPEIDMSKVTMPVLVINGEYDRPLSKSHRAWRELNHVTKVMLPGKQHLTAVMPGYCPQAFIDAMVAHIVPRNPK